MIDLTDTQWCFMDLLARAKAKGIDKVSRTELLASPALPDYAKFKIVFSGLLIADGNLVILHQSNEFEITERGLRAFNAKFGRGESAATPTAVADIVIALPGRSERIQ